jgi:hypothetical protein
MTAALAGLSHAQVRDWVLARQVNPATGAGPHDRQILRRLALEEPWPGAGPALTLQRSPASQNMPEMGIYTCGSEIKTSAPVLPFFIPNGPG